MLTYAVKNAELIGQLRREVALEKQLEAEAQELRGIRERTLHKIADALHDTVVSDVRGLQLWLAGMRQEQPKNADTDPTDLNFIEETLSKIYEDARRIMEGAKPVDFAVEGLLDSLKRSMRHF